MNEADLKAQNARDGEAYRLLQARKLILLTAIDDLRDWRKRFGHNEEFSGIAQMIDQLNEPLPTIQLNKPWPERGTVENQMMRKSVISCGQK